MKIPKVLEILYEDDDLIFINKPAGLVSQATPDPNRPNVISLLKTQFPSRDFFLHHRLDKDTSGVLLVGKTAGSNAALTNVFREHLINKVYLSLVLVKSDAAEIPASFTVDNHLAPVRGPQKQLMRMVSVKKGGWKAETHFSFLKQLRNFACIEARPVTGRTHQIRVHLAGLKLPIAGDFLYGGKSSLVPRLMLHAKQLTLPHPISGNSITVEAPLPSDFMTILEKG